MKKITQVLAFCLFAFGLSAKNISPLDSLCSVNVVMDSSVVNGATIAVAQPSGTAPFAYLWDTGETTEFIEITQWGVNYCVTVTDASGCTAEGCLFGTSDCAVFITNNPAGGLTANANGQSPYIYYWSNGSQTQSIQPNDPGNYTVTVIDNSGCTATASTFWNGNPVNCSTFIVVDSFENGGWPLLAVVDGLAPFSYLWSSQNASSASIFVTEPGTYCVTVTDANGCISTGCTTIDDPDCLVDITFSNTTGINILTAVTILSPASYLWSTGETTQSIEPQSAGLYCVTVTGGGCVGSVCDQFFPPSNFSLLGYVILEDSSQTGDLEGIAELFNLDQNTGEWNLTATVNLQNNPNDWTASYDFGDQPTGNYLIKITLTPGSQYADEYLPTYYVSSIDWLGADMITLPNVWNGFLITMNDGQNLTAGSGSINGTVTQGDGFTANEEGDRGGDPRPNTSILLFDENEQPITHTKTDDLGHYSFANLPLGTYKVHVEIVGKAGSERWVDLTALNPTSSGNDFEVTPTGIVLGLDELLENANSLVALPNPTTGQLKLVFEATASFEANIKLARLDGTTVFVENQQVAMGQNAIDVDMAQVPAGLYLLQLTTGKGVSTAKIVKK